MSLANKINQRTVICLFVICGVIAINSPITTFFDTITNLIIPQAVAAPGDGKLYFVHNNHLGTPVAMTNEAGEKVWSAEHKPFGKATVNTDVDGDGEHVELNARFPGQQYDKETGLHYNYYRYYNPSTGRYMTSDPIGLSGGLNTFGYVGGNPFNRSDSLGLAFFDNRPLSGMHGNPNRSPVADYLNIEASHEQLFFEDAEGGNIGFFDDGNVRPDDPNNLKKYWGRQRYKNYDDARMRQAVGNVGDPGKYCLIGPGQNNCQDWADKVRNEYERLKKETMTCDRE